MITEISRGNHLYCAHTLLTTIMRNKVEDDIHFLFNCEKYNEFRKNILGIGPNGGNKNTDRVVYLKEIFNTSPQKLARYIEKAYVLRTSSIKN